MNLNNHLRKIIPADFWTIQLLQLPSFLRWFWVISLILIGLHMAVSWHKIVTTQAPDFVVYYYSAVHFLQRLPLYGATGLPTGLGYPPQTVFVYIPLTVLPYNLAQAVWISASFVSIPFSCYLCFKILKQPISWMMLITISSLIFLSFPTKFTLGMGQVNLIALVFLLLGIYSERRKNISGLFWSMAILLKPQFVFLLVVLALTKRIGIIIWTVMWYTAVTAVTISIFGIQEVNRYLLVESKSLSAFVARGIYYNQGASGFLSRWFPESIAKNGVHVVRLVAAIAVVKISSQLRRLSTSTIMLLSLPILLLWIPVVWQHHFIFLIPAYLWGIMNSRTKIQMTLFISSWILISINLKQPEVFQGFLRIALDHGFWGLLLLGVAIFQTVKQTR